MDADDRLLRVLSALEESVCSDADVEFVVAFGSQVSGEATRTSDLDVAIKFADHLSDRERFEKRCFLSGALQRDDAPFVDLSDIETAFADQRDSLRRRQREVIDRIAEDGLRG